MGSLGRAFRIGSSSGRLLRLGSDAELAAGHSSCFSGRAQSRGMAGGHHGDHHTVTYEGLSLHKASSWHTNAARGFGGLMWFWIFYRFYHDYDTFLFGHAQHFEHELHEEAHGHAEKGHAAAHH